MPFYEAESRILILKNSPYGASSWDDVLSSKHLAPTYSQLIREGEVLSKVIDRLALETTPAQLRGMIKSSLVSESPILIISTRDTDPVLAAQVANTLAEVFISHTEEQRLLDIARLQSAAAAYGVSLDKEILREQLAAMGSFSIVRRATVPSSPIKPRRGYKVAGGVAMAGLVALLVIYLLESLADKVRSPETLKGMEEVEFIEVIPRWGKALVDRRESVMIKSPRDIHAESYRHVVSRFQTMWAQDGTGDSRSLVVSSSGPSEGKTTTAVNLAIAIAEGGSKVLLVDGDIERPEVHRWFNIKNDAGFRNLLADPDVDPKDVIEETNIPNLRVVATGSSASPRGSLVVKSAVDRVMRSLKAEAEVVVVDTAPILALSDSFRLVSAADETILVAHGQTTRVTNLRRAAELVGKARNTLTEPVKVVLNHFLAPRLAYYRKQYYYSRYYGGVYLSAGGAATIDSKRSQSRSWRRLFRRSK